MEADSPSFSQQGRSQAARLATCAESPLRMRRTNLIASLLSELLELILMHLYDSKREQTCVILAGRILISRMSTVVYNISSWRTHYFSRTYLSLNDRWAGFECPASLRRPPYRYTQTCSGRTPNTKDNSGRILMPGYEGFTSSV